MKVFAYYLPQFHRIPENDKWWGEGFTEWTNSKNAKPLFDGHNQPNEPLNDNYYNILDYETIRWQTDIAKKYGIDGFVYYHYYFKGKKLLEKPAENFLRWKDIEHNFYFCWANHTWYKSHNGEKVVLQEQIYGDESDWREHFEYLLPFFRDERYVKIDNKPVFQLFLPRFKEKRKMLKKFNEWSIEEGFAGIYIIESMLMMLPQKELCLSGQDKYILREPNHAKFIYDCFYRKKKEYVSTCIGSGEELKIPVYDGNLFFDIMIKCYRKNKKVIHSMAFEWDNTPRHGNRGYIILPVCKNKVMEYLELVKNEDIFLVNAWNEWSEGMILEPTKRNKFKYLEWIKEWKDSLV